MSFHDREHLEVSRAEEIVTWLSSNHATAPGVWIVTHKKGTGEPAPTYDDIVRAALRFGWVDSVPGTVDDRRTKLYLSPRKASSAWSQSNKQRIEELTADGLMEPAGVAAVESAKASGMWSAIDSAQRAEIPDDLTEEFARHDGSRENFEAFPLGVRKQILEWISLAKTAATREKRIVETATLAAQNIRANQWRGPKAT